MRAYVIVDINITNTELYEAYKKLTPATLAAYDGKFIVRGGEAKIMEGTWQPDRIVVLEFPSVKRAKEWWNSEIYTEAKNIRQQAAETQMIIVEGI